MTTSPPVTSRAPPLSASLLSNVELCTVRVPPLTSIAPPSRPSKTALEIDRCPREMRSARGYVPASSLRLRLPRSLPNQQPSISAAPPSIKICPLSSSPCSVTRGAPARSSKLRAETLLEIMVEASLAAVISSRESVRFASSTRPPTMCVPADSLSTNSLPDRVSSTGTLKRASSTVS